jgi:hypothetical protein
MTDALDTLTAALKKLAGYERVVLYRVPANEPPSIVSAVCTRGPAEWWDFVKERRAFDDGEFTIVISLRALSESEAHLVLDWGSRFGNTFLLVEPLDSTFDLTQPDRLQRFVAQARPDDPSSFVDLLSRFYGRWLYWPAPPEFQSPMTVQLDLVNVTLKEALQREMEQRFPPPTFDSALRDLVVKEEELFTSLTPVSRVVIPFFSRLGLPVPYDPRLITRAFRQVVNDGLAWVREPVQDGNFFRGPKRPVPPSLTDEEFEALVR